MESVIVSFLRAILIALALFRRRRYHVDKFHFSKFYPILIKRITASVSDSQHYPGNQYLLCVSEESWIM